MLLLVEIYMVDIYSNVDVREEGERSRVHSRSYCPAFVC